MVSGLISGMDYFYGSNWYTLDPNAPSQFPINTILQLRPSWLNNGYQGVKGRVSIEVSRVSNLLFNSSFEIGDPPTSWSGTLIARSTTQVKFGSYSVAITRAGANVSCRQELSNYPDFAGKIVTLACWVYASAANQARLAINDGVGSSASAYHSGNPGWERLTVTRTINSSPTMLRAAIQVNNVDGTVYADGAALVEGSSCPDYSDIMLSITANQDQIAVPSQGYMTPSSSFSLDQGGVYKAKVTLEEIGYDDFNITNIERVQTSQGYIQGFGTVYYYTPRVTVINSGTISGSYLLSVRYWFVNNPSYVYGPYIYESNRYTLNQSESKIDYIKKSDGSKFEVWNSYEKSYYGSKTVEIAVVALQSPLTLRNPITLTY